MEAENTNNEQIVSLTVIEQALENEKDNIINRTTEMLKLEEREILLLDREVAIGLAYKDYDDSLWMIIKNQILDTSRWTGRYELIVKRLCDGKFFKSYYTSGLTESQEQEPYEHGECKFTQVFETQEITTVYK